MNLRSDNEAPVADAILAAIIAANDGSAAAYGDDHWTRLLDERFGELFEAPVRVFPLCTGTAANALAIAHLTPNYGAVLCHELAHVLVDECGAPELFSGGARMLGLPGQNGQLLPATVSEALNQLGPGGDHDPLPAVLTVTQATECGTVYPPEQLAELAQIAKSRGLHVHMDGARFANAVAASGLSPTQMSVACGVDVLSFGATKNGTLGAEAVIFFDLELARQFGRRRMKGGQLLSKMRYTSAQLLRYIEGDLWLDFARHANAMAARLARGLAGVAGAALLYPVQANELFVKLAPELNQRLSDAGIAYHPWPGQADGYRWVTSYATAPAQVDQLLELVSNP